MHNFSDEQVGAAAKALHETQNLWFYAHGDWGAAGFEIKQAFRKSARAALVAAAGATPQAESETIIGAVMRTSSMACHIAVAADGMEESHGAGCGHVPILTPAVQQVSESDLDNVLRREHSTTCDGKCGILNSEFRRLARAVVAALGGEARE